MQFPPEKNRRTFLAHASFLCKTLKINSSNKLILFARAIFIHIKNNLGYAHFI